VIVGFKTPEHALPLVSEVHIAHSYAATFEDILSIRFDEQDEPIPSEHSNPHVASFSSLERLSG